MMAIDNRNIKVKRPTFYLKTTLWRFVDIFWITWCILRNLIGRVTSSQCWFIHSNNQNKHLIYSQKTWPVLNLDTFTRNYKSAMDSIFRSCEQTYEIYFIDKLQCTWYIEHNYNFQIFSPIQNLKYYRPHFFMRVYKRHLVISRDEKNIYKPPKENLRSFFYQKLVFITL